MKKIIRNLLALSATILSFPLSSFAYVNVVIEQVGDDVEYTISGGYDNVNGLNYDTAGGYVGETPTSFSFTSSIILYSGSDATTNQLISVTDFSLNRINGDVIATNKNAGRIATDTSTVTGTGSFYAQFYTNGYTSLNLAYDHDNDKIFDSVAYAGSATWEDTTIAALGFAPASYEIRWDSGNQGINVTVVPEPSAYAALASLFAFGFVGCRRKFKA